MINITRKEDCCGCLSCVQACSKDCIEAKADKHGFIYPVVNHEICVECGACEKACPIIHADHQTTLGSDTPAYACYNRNEEIRRDSSSGGFFTLIAEYVINHKGAVFGAKFDKEWKVFHSYTETIEGIDDFRRSKYVQSYIGESYKQVRSFLKDGRLVLFTGTPCQIAGLRSFLKKEYENLICLDFICHGVPSPAVWDKYLNEKRIEIARENSINGSENIVVTQISFRDKSNGWRKFSLSISYCVLGKEGLSSEQKTSVEYIWENDYMLCFLKDFINRPSCFECKFRNGRSHSDITMADFWSVERWINDDNFSGDKGTSLLLLHTPKASTLVENLDMERQPVEYDKAQKGNPAIYRDWERPTWHDVFLNALTKKDIKSVYEKYAPLEEKTIPLIHFFKRVKSKLKRLWQKLEL